MRRGDERQRPTRELIDQLLGEPLDVGAVRDLTGLHACLEPGRVREPTRRKRRVGELEDEPVHQNNEYRWVSGSVVAGSQVSATPSARTS